VSHVPYLELQPGLAELAPELTEACESVLGAGHLVLGPQVEAFEEEFARACGSAQCVGVGNGYDALVLGLRALGVSSGDDVLVPAQAHITDWLAVSAVGAHPIGVDVDEVTGNLDPELVDQAWTERTRAMVVVHLYGHPAPMDRLAAWARRRGVAVLADASHAHGARWAGRPIGAWGDAVAWSFYPTKNLGALGDGGAVTTDEPSVAQRVRVLRNYGSTSRDVVLERGANSRLDELQAAFLRVKLRHLDEWNARRSLGARRYVEGLSGLALTLPRVTDGATHAWHLFVIRTAERADLQAHLAAEGIETLAHYPTPPFAQGAYAALCIDPRRFPHATAWAAECLSLPLGPHLSMDQQDRVIDALARCVTGSGGH